MKTIAAMLALAVALLVASLALGDREIRDRNGRLLYREYQTGNRIEVRDRYGVLQEVKTRRGNKIYVRDRHGRLLRIEKIH